MTLDGGLLITGSFLQVVFLMFFLSKFSLLYRFCALPVPRTSCVSSRAVALCSLICFTNPKASKALAAGLMKDAS